MIVLLIDIINWKPAVTLLRNIWPCSLQSLHPGLMFQPHCHCPLWPEVAQGNLYPEFVLAQAGTSHLTGHRVAEMRPKGAPWSWWPAFPWSPAPAQPVLLGQEHLSWAFGCNCYSQNPWCRCRLCHVIFLKATDFSIQKLDGWMEVLDVFTFHAYTNIWMLLAHIFVKKNWK